MPYDFRQQYIQDCAEAGNPLNSVQQSALELNLAKLEHYQRVGEKTLQAEKLPVEQLDIAALREAAEKVGYNKFKDLENSVRTYRGTIEPSVDHSSPLSDFDVLKLYERATQIIDTSNPHFPFGRTQRHDMPQRFGVKAYTVLQQYLIDRGLIDPAKAYKIPEQSLQAFHRERDVKIEDMGDLGLSSRTRNLLINLGYETASQLTKVNEEELLEQERFGKGSLDEVKKGLKKLGKSLKGE